jgi:hypothetical protein
MCAGASWPRTDSIAAYSVSSAWDATGRVITVLAPGQTYDHPRREDNAVTADRPASEGEILRASADYVESLARALRELGLAVVREKPNSLLVSNPALERADSWAYTMLRQEVTCGRREDRDTELWWFWVWPGLTRDSHPELAPLCPAASVERAVVAIARVLAVRPPDNAATVQAGQTLPRAPSAESSLPAQQPPLNRR